MQTVPVSEYSFFLVGDMSGQDIFVKYAQYFDI